MSKCEVYLFENQPVGSELLRVLVAQVLGGLVDGIVREIINRHNTIPHFANCSNPLSFGKLFRRDECRVTNELILTGSPKQEKKEKTNGLLVKLNQSQKIKVSGSE